MGQFVTALMLGVSSSAFEGVVDFDDFIQDLDGMEPKRDHERKIIGYYIAISPNAGDDNDDIPSLTGPVAIRAIESVYEEAIAIARAHWSVFAAFAKENGVDNVDIDEPAIYIVSVEIDLATHYRN